MKNKMSDDEVLAMVTAGNASAKAQMAEARKAVTESMRLLQKVPELTPAKLKPLKT